MEKSKTKLKIIRKYFCLNNIMIERKIILEVNVFAKLVFTHLY